MQLDPSKPLIFYLKRFICQALFASDFSSPQLVAKDNLLEEKIVCSHLKKRLFALTWRKDCLLSLEEKTWRKDCFLSLEEKTWRKDRLLSLDAHTTQGRAWVSKIFSQLLNIFRFNGRSSCTVTRYLLTHYCPSFVFRWFLRYNLRVAPIIYQLIGGTFIEFFFDDPFFFKIEIFPIHTEYSRSVTNGLIYKLGCLKYNYLMCKS